MGDILRKIYNFYAPAIVVIWLTVSGHWVWLLGAIGLLLVIISNNIEAHLRITATGTDEILQRISNAGLEGRVRT